MRGPYDPHERVATCGQRIAEALAKKGMRQSELCKIADIPKSSMSLYLSGAYEPKQDKAYRIAQALDVSSEWLMGYDVPSVRLPWEEKSPGERQLTEGEEQLIELFRRVPAEQQGMVLEMIRAALGLK